jgi:hypothetical protein
LSSTGVGGSGSWTMSPKTPVLRYAVPPVGKGNP